MFSRRLGGLRLALAAAGAAFIGWAASAAPARGEEILVFAAASLKNALDEVGAQWRKETGKTAKIAYAASSALAKQIDAGAPADVFISADLAWMDFLADKKLIRAETRTDLLGNRLVLIAPKASAASLGIAPGFPLAAAIGDGRLAMANVDAVPAGKYGRAALENLGVWSSVKDKTAQAQNVRAALLLVARGEAPFGVVYRTDAAAEPDVRIVDVFPEAAHPPIVYPVALTAEAGAYAAAFLAYVTSSAARAAFEGQGFTAPK